MDGLKWAEQRGPTSPGVRDAGGGGCEGGLLTPGASPLGAAAASVRPPPQPRPQLRLRLGPLPVAPPRSDVRDVVGVEKASQRLLAPLK